MQIEIQLDKTLQQNAALYFEKSKKAKKKLEGLLKAIPETEKKLKELKEKKNLKEQAKKITKKRQKEWYEKFHWFFSSDNYLVLAGKDQKSNEVLVKKYMEPSDIYFHAEIQGAAHTIVKSKDNKSPEQTMKEAATFAAVHSKAWKENLASVDVYSVLPNQVSKKAPSGEALATGAFMIYGERQWFKNTQPEFAIGVKKANENYQIISGPLTAIKKNSHNGVYLKIIQGNEEKGSLSKKIRHLLEKKLHGNFELSLDEIIAMLPAGKLAIA